MLNKLIITPWRQQGSGSIGPPMCISSLRWTWVVSYKHRLSYSWGKKRPIVVGQEAELAPEPVLTLRGTENLLPLQGIEPGLSARRLAKYIRRWYSFSVYLRTLWISRFYNIGWLIHWKIFESKLSWPDRGNILAFVWRDWEKIRKASVRISGVSAKIWTEYIPNTSQSIA
jgi:hypothetical protein